MSVVIPELAVGSSGKLSTMTHDEQLQAMFFALSLGKYADAWEIGIALNDTNEWIKAANSALVDFNIEFGNQTTYLIFL